MGRPAVYGRVAGRSVAAVMAGAHKGRRPADAGHAVLMTASS